MEMKEPLNRNYAERLRLLFEKRRQKCIDVADRFLECCFLNLEDSLSLEASVHFIGDDYMLPDSLKDYIRVLLQERLCAIYPDATVARVGNELIVKLPLNALVPPLPTVQPKMDASSQTEVGAVTTVSAPPNVPAVPEPIKVVEATPTPTQAPASLPASVPGKLAKVIAGDYVFIRGENDLFRFACVKVVNEESKELQVIDSLADKPRTVPYLPRDVIGPVVANADSSCAAPPDENHLRAWLKAVQLVLHHGGVLAVRTVLSHSCDKVPGMQHLVFQCSLFGYVHSSSQDPRISEGLREVATFPRALDGFYLTVFVPSSKRSEPLYLGLECKREWLVPEKLFASYCG